MHLLFEGKILTLLNGICKDIWEHIFLGFPGGSAVALFTTAKLWKQPKSPSIDEWIKKM